MSVKGLVDYRVAKELSKNFPLDQNYLDFLSGLEEGEVDEVVKAGDKTIKIELYLSLFDNRTDLQNHIEHFELDMDKRKVESVDYLTDYEHATTRHLFSDILPFAATMKDMCLLDRSYVDLFCFDFRKEAKERVVLWKGDEASEAYFDWEEIPYEEIDEGDEFKTVDFDSFLVPISRSFVEFRSLIEKSGT